MDLDNFMTLTKFGHVKTADDELLDLAIQKWQEIVAGERVDHGSDDCALCLKYKSHLYATTVLHQDSNPGCSGCPVKNWTGSSSCRYTPYYSYVSAIKYRNGDDKVKYANMMVDMLKEVKNGLRSGRSSIGKKVL